MFKWFLYTLVLLGTLEIIQCEKKTIEEQLANAISDQVSFGKTLAKIGEKSTKTINEKLDIANNTLADLYNHSLSIFSGQVEYVQRILKSPLKEIENYSQVEAQKLKRYKNLVNDLNRAIEKNNVACQREFPLFDTDDTLDTLFQTAKSILPLIMAIQEDDCRKYHSEVTTCEAVHSLPSSCAEAKPGIQKLLLEGNVFEVLCEAGGWTVLMKRFYPHGKKFDNAFELGNLCGEFLLDKEIIIRLLRKESHVTQIVHEDPEYSVTFDNTDFEPTDRKKQNYVLTAHGVQDESSEELELSATWLPFKSNIDSVKKIRIRPTSLTD